MADSQEPDVEATAVEDATDDTSLEEMEVSFDDLGDDGTEETEEQSEESAEESESNESEEETQEGSSEEEQEESEEETEAQADDKSEEETAEEATETKSADEQKRLNNEAAQKRIAERAERERLRQLAQAKYLEDAEDDKDLALKQLQIDAYNNKVERNSDKLKTGIDRALADIDLFRDGSPEVKEYLISKVDEFERQYVSYSSTGDPVEVRADVYEYLQKEADSVRRLTDVGARKNAADKQKVKAKTIPRPSKTPKDPKVDPDLAAFDEEVAKYR
jgi:hypothetical protein